MKDKKDGKSRAYGSITHQNNSPLASSTTEKDDLTHRSYYHHNYYPSSIPAASIFPVNEMTMNYGIKPSNYYTPTPYENYYLNSQNSTVYQQQPDPGLLSFI
jgi:hypothetical protein